MRSHEGSIWILKLEHMREGILKFSHGIKKINGNFKWIVSTCCNLLLICILRKFTTIIILSYKKKEQVSVFRIFRVFHANNFPEDLHFNYLFSLIYKGLDKFSVPTFCFLNTSLMRSHHVPLKGKKKTQ